MPHEADSGRSTPRKPTSPGSRKLADAIAAGLFSNGQGEKADFAVMTAADGKKIVSWPKDTIAHFVALLIDRVKGIEHG